jgi:hypothetical protein
VAFGFGVAFGFSGVGAGFSAMGFVAFLGVGVAFSTFTGVGFGVAFLRRPKRRCQKPGFGVDMGSGVATGIGVALALGRGSAGVVADASAGAGGTLTRGVLAGTGSEGGAAGVGGGGGTSCCASRLTEVRMALRK